jgi:DNA/RNA endonuclease G (NUC1)
MKKVLNTFGLLSLLVLFTGFFSPLDDVKVKNNVFDVTYSQRLEQPLSLTYRSINRPTNVNRGSMDFYKEPNVHTSDGADYVRNIWDKGHLAPAATFSDNMENLKQTFSYLNCALQDQYLNRGEWRLLEEKERVWDDVEPLTVTIDVHFNGNCQVLQTGATVPSGFTKHIYFENSKKYTCYSFDNSRPQKGWEDHRVKCAKH